MIVALLVLVPVLAASVLVYVRCRPHVADARRAALRVFDGAVWLLVLGADGALARYVKTSVGQGADRAWWPVLAVLSCVCLTAAILLLGALIRVFAFRGK